MRVIKDKIDLCVFPKSVLLTSKFLGCGSSQHSGSRPSAPEIKMIQPKESKIWHHGCLFSAFFYYKVIAKLIHRVNFSSGVVTVVSWYS